MEIEEKSPPPPPPPPPGDENGNWLLCVGPKSSQTFPESSQTFPTAGCADRDPSKPKPSSQTFPTAGCADQNPSKPKPSSQPDDISEQSPALPPQTLPPASPVWTPQEEIILFHSLIRHKPVGFDRHLRMIFIHKRFESRWRTRESAKRVPERVTAEMLWKKLDSMYNLTALNYENQIPDEFKKQVEFELPKADFNDLMDEQMMSSLKIRGDDEDDVSEQSGTDQTHDESEKSIGRRGRKSGARVAQDNTVSASASMPPGNVVPMIVLSRLSCEDFKMKGKRRGGK